MDVICASEKLEFRSMIFDGNLKFPVQNQTVNGLCWIAYIDKTSGLFPTMLNVTLLQRWSILFLVIYEILCKCEEKHIGQTKSRVGTHSKEYNKIICRTLRARVQPHIYKGKMFRFLIQISKKNENLDISTKIYLFTIQTFF